MKKPNVILIMTDDQGYGDLSCMGATDFVTPHLDRMAREGTRFSCMYSGSPVCSPSRATLLTGRYPGYAGVPAIVSWPGQIPAGRVIDSPHAAMDVFPTVLEACGGDVSRYTLDGESMLDMLLGGEEKTHEALYWEMERQTAVRRGKYKLVLNGQLVEGEAQRAPVFLSDLENDPGERINLADELPELTASLREEALAWRNRLEANWERQFAGHYRDLT